MSEHWRLTRAREPLDGVRRRCCTTRTRNAGFGIIARSLFARATRRGSARRRRAFERRDGLGYSSRGARAASRPHSDARPRDAAADARARADELSPTARRGATRERRAMTTMGRGMTTTSTNDGR